MRRPDADGITLTVLSVKGGCALLVNGKAVALPCHVTPRDRLSVVRLADLKPSTTKAA